MSWFDEIPERKKKILQCIETGDPVALYVLLSEFNAPHAVAFVLSALAEDEITENGAKAFRLLRESIDPAKKGKW